MTRLSSPVVVLAFDVLLLHIRTLAHMIMSLLTKGFGNFSGLTWAMGALTLAVSFPPICLPIYLPEFCIPSSVSHFYFPNMVFSFLLPGGCFATFGTTGIARLPYGVLLFVYLPLNVLPLLNIRFVLHGF